MYGKNIHVTCPACRQNLCLNRSTRITYRCNHCQGQLSGSVISSVLLTKSALKDSKNVGVVFLLSVGLFVCSAPSVLGVSPSASITSQPNWVSNPSVLTANNRSLPSSSVLISRVKGGGTLQVYNGTNLDAYVKLVDPSSRQLVAVFHIDSNSTFTFKNVPDGTYQVLFMLGKDWNDRTQSFTKRKSLAKFDQDLNFTTTQVGRSIRYGGFKITLHSVVGGNTTTSRVNEQEFNRY
jgi:hypothetical protein